MFNFEKFTKSAQNTILLSQEIMHRYQNNQMDAEHVMLAFLESDENVVKDIFEKLKVNENQLKNDIERILSQKPKLANAYDSGQIFTAPALKRVLTTQQCKHKTSVIHLSETNISCLLFSRINRQKQQKFSTPLM